MKSRNWVCSDLHFNHVAKMQEYCKRPENYEQMLFSSMYYIPAGDTLYCLGDVCIGDDLNVHKNYISPLRCKKILIRGNHDKKTPSWYKEHGWDEVYSELIVPIKGGKRALLTHKPQNDLQGATWNVHGHFHNSAPHHEDEHFPFLDERHILVAMEYLDYKPVQLEDFVLFS